MVIMVTYLEVAIFELFQVFLQKKILISIKIVIFFSNYAFFMKKNKK